MELMLFENVVLSELCSEWVTSLNKDSFGSYGSKELEWKSKERFMTF